MDSCCAFCFKHEESLQLFGLKQSPFGVFRGLKYGQTIFLLLGLFQGPEKAPFGRFQGPVNATLWLFKVK
jgi:hypothetical protein